MNIRTMTAPRLRLILTITLFVTMVIITVVFNFAHIQLKKVADDVSQTVAKANASQDNLQALQRTEKELEQSQKVVERASEVVANSQRYNYQDQIINDLNRYARRAGVSVTNIDFSAASGTTAPATGGSAQAPATGPVAAPSGVRASTISVTLKTPLSYRNLLNFMRSIEQNLTKMQIASVNLTQSETGMTTDVLTIGIFVR